jgi:hypothetical protein
MERIELPAKIGGNFSGFADLARIQKLIRISSASKLVLDCKGIVFFGSNLCAVLGGIIHQAEREGKEVVVQNIPELQAMNWDRNFFKPKDIHNPSVDFNDTVVHYRAFSVKASDSFRPYIHQELLSKHDMPRMSEALTTKILESIHEIFSNAIIHSGCEVIFTCGQYFPHKRTLEFTIVDMGHTIKANVSTALKRHQSGQSALEWAVEKGNTTRSGSIPGGLGFYVIREFLRVNRGKIQIASGDGYWEENNGKRTSRYLFGDFPGTIVNLTFIMQDNKAYRLENESNDEPLF